jgi:hypothetical protein
MAIREVSARRRSRRHPAALPRPPHRCLAVADRRTMRRSFSRDGWVTHAAIVTGATVWGTCWSRADASTLRCWSRPSPCRGRRRGRGWARFWSSWAPSRGKSSPTSSISRSRKRCTRSSPGPAARSARRRGSRSRNQPGV